MRREVHRDGRVFTLSPALSAEDCAALVARAEAEGFEEAPVTTGLGAVRLPSVRNNQRAMFDDPEAAEALWRRVAPGVLPVDGLDAIGLNERLRVYRYAPGQFFRRHLDGAWRPRPGVFSVYTLLIWLNDDYEGGETCFGDLTFTPRRGDALLFLHRQMHAGLPVRRGTKIMLRSDVMFRVPGQR